MQSDTVYSFFLQHSSLLGTKDEQSELICPCQQSGSKALILWDKEYQCDVEQHLRAIRNEKAMGTKFLNHFRRRMANMRHHQLLPSADSKTGPPDLEKCVNSCPTCEQFQLIIYHTQEIPSTIARYLLDVCSEG